MWTPGHDAFTNAISDLHYFWGPDDLQGLGGRPSWILRAICKDANFFFPSEGHGLWTAPCWGRTNGG